MKLTKIATIGTLAISIAGLSACNNMMPAKSADMKAPTHSQKSMAKMNVVQVAQSNPDFSVLVEAVQAAGLAGMLSDPNAHYTVFAPTNAAFMEALQETGMTKAQLFANKPLLTKVLGYHVISSDMAIYAKDVKPGNVMTASKDTLMVTKEGKLMDENGRTASILKTDIAANNGVVHVIDKVLLPK
ncbi:MULTISPECIES: fasciclin domain-containing protein [unclassified Psychrobacter]|uniref:fasciclin domain-containing protein n=1 Tax=unclassified Psychrobacter TaxID=196806 RepID=UPI0025B4B889|nr:MULTISPECIES: fasciclin domain-containing protein [unclassified Psychrobacter]MDN3454435.1 fasciclin domain-containing protein [Psychrobacter sp. APC 3350]MDN3502100.1 fasciclin domain-containing protein [Psychrobacter sp. 5A.1]